VKESTCVWQLQLCIQQKAGKTVVADASKTEQIGLSQKGNPDPESAVEVAEEAKHLNMDSDSNGSQEEHSPDDMRWVTLVIIIDDTSVELSRNLYYVSFKLLATEVLSHWKRWLTNLLPF